MLRVYPQLADLKVTHAWGGTLAITVNRMPAFQRLAPDVFSAAGYSGHGVAMATLAGKLMAEAVRGTAERFDLFATLPQPGFPGGAALRWPLLVLAMSWYGCATGSELFRRGLRAQLAELLEGQHRVGGIHHRRPAAHVDRHAERLQHLLARHAELDQRVHVKADAAVAAGGDADGQRNQLLGLGVERAGLRRRPRQFRETLHRLGDVAAQHAHVRADAPGDLGIGFRHGWPLVLMLGKD
jgi:hypothetical protein